MIFELVADVLRLRSQIRAGAALPAGMLDAVVAGALLRPRSLEALRAHYCVSMPAQRSRQLSSPLFQARL
ncbi:MAG TPA: hypothetical protein VH083_27870, partial [Myxococcales bacterium]|nr:hypothetical protein [Myxococcales bacterium]